ncbi:MAG: hypothetical protein ACOX88_03785 [Christensenellales bacterium]
MKNNRIKRLLFSALCLVMALTAAGCGDQPQTAPPLMDGYALYETDTYSIQYKQDHSVIDEAFLTGAKDELLQMLTRMGLGNFLQFIDVQAIMDVLKSAARDADVAFLEFGQSLFDIRASVTVHAWEGQGVPAWQFRSSLARNVIEEKITEALSQNLPPEAVRTLELEGKSLGNNYFYTLGYEYEVSGVRMLFYAAVTVYRQDVYIVTLTCAPDDFEDKRPDFEKMLSTLTFK